MTVCVHLSRGGLGLRAAGPDVGLGTRRHAKGERACSDRRVRLLWGEKWREADGASVEAPAGW